MAIFSIEQRLYFPKELLLLRIADRYIYCFVGRFLATVSAANSTLGWSFADAVYSH
jgi:hypothetical protein